MEGVKQNKGEREEHNDMCSSSLPKFDLHMEKRSLSS